MKLWFNLKEHIVKQFVQRQMTDDLSQLKTSDVTKSGFELKIARSVLIYLLSGPLNYHGSLLSFVALVYHAFLNRRFFEINFVCHVTKTI